MPIESVSSSAANAVLDADTTEGAAAPPKPVTRSPADERAIQISTYEALTPPKPKPNPCIYGEIRKALSTGLTDWAITNADTDRVQKLLVSMPKPQCTATLEQMQHDGLLDRFIGSMDPARRDGLLEQLHAKGLFGKTTPIPSQGKLDPPAPPATYENATELPLALRAAIHLSTYEGQQRYVSQYGAYQDRYVAAVNATKSAAELRDLGPYASPASVAEHLNYFDKDFRFLKRGNTATAPSISASKAAYAVQAKLDSFKGMGPAGVPSLKAMVEADSLTTRTRITADVDGSGVRLHPESNLRAGTEEFNVETEGVSPKLKRVELNAEGIGGVAVESDGTVEISGHITPLAGVYSTMNGREKVIGGGIELGVAGARARVGGEARGLTEEEVKMMFSSTGFFDIPAPLQRGIAWDQIPAGLKHELEYHGWTEQEWARRSVK